jgi:hypothetical protein
MLVPRSVARARCPVNEVHMPSLCDKCLRTSLPMSILRMALCLAGPVSGCRGRSASASSGSRGAMERPASSLILSPRTVFGVSTTPSS